MPRLSSLAWRSLVSRRLRSLLTVAGIALGVSVLFATLATSAGIEQSVDQTVADLMGRADLRVTAVQEIGLSPATQAAIAGTPGVTLAAPEIEQRTYLLPVAGSTVSGPRPPVTVRGIDPNVGPLLHPMTLVAGELLTPGRLGALVSERLATDEGLAVGRSVSLAGIALPDQSAFPIVGIIADQPGIPNARLVVVPLENAAVVFGLAGVTRIDLGLARPTNADVVAGALESRITTQPYALSTPADIAASLRSSTVDFQATTALIAAVALFVGALLIFNTLSMTVVERVREVALLRAAGTTRSQVQSFVLLQALVLGLAGSVVGVSLGYGLALLLAQALGPHGTIGSVALRAPAVPVSGIILAIGIGVAVTIASALEPAWRAGRISPVEGLRRQPDLSGVSATRLRWLVVVFVVIGAAGLVMWPRDWGGATAFRSLAVYAALLLATIASPLVLPALGRLVGIPFAAVLRAEERLARGAIVRDPARTALTVGSLAVGLAMIVAVGGVAQNDRVAAAGWLAEVVPGDEVVTAIRPTGLGEGVQQELEAVDGVNRVSPMARFDLSYAGVRLDAAAVVGSDLLVDGRLNITAGDRRAALNSLDGTGAVILPRSQASRLGLRVGDHMTIVAADGQDRQMRVAGIAARTLPGRTGETILVGWPDAAGVFGVIGADVFAVRYDPAQIATARLVVDEKARALALEPASLETVQGAISDTLSRVFRLFDVLAAIAVIVAGLGIVNTLTMNVFERVHEIGVLRAAGMTRRQVWRMVLVEAGVMGVLAAVLGCIVGLGVGVLMLLLARGPDVLAGLEIPWLTIGLAAVFGIAVSMLASYYPARLASRMSIVRAVQHE